MPTDCGALGSGPSLTCKHSSPALAGRKRQTQGPCGETAQTVECLSPRLLLRELPRSCSTGRLTQAQDKSEACPDCRSRAQFRKLKIFLK